MIGGLNGLKGLDPRRRKAVGGASSKIPVYNLPKALGFRIRSLATSGSWWRVVELEGYPQANYAGSRYKSGTPAGYSVSYVADSVNGTETTNSAFDGNTGSQWGSGNGDIGKWIGITYAPGGSPPTLASVAAMFPAQQLADDPTILVKTFADQMEAYYLPYMLDVKSVRWLTYNNGSNHFSPSVALDFRRVNNLGEFSWEEVATIDGATSPNVYYGWTSL